MGITLATLPLLFYKESPTLASVGNY